MFQRMMAIPQEEYLQLTAAQQVRQPLMQQFYNLENQYREQNQIADPYSKLVHQSETLDALKALKDKMRNEIVLATPKPYQSRARSLFQHLEPILKVNERGEIFDDRGQVISQSRIEDLIQYAVRDRRRHFLPTGWKTFLETLRIHNIPKYMLNRYTLDEMEKPTTTPAPVTPLKVKKEVMTTPKRIVNMSAAKKKVKRLTFSPVKQRPKRERKTTVKYGVDFLKNF